MLIRPSIAALLLTAQGAAQAPAPILADGHVHREGGVNFVIDSVAPEGEALAPTLDDWVKHVEHDVQVAGPRSVAIGLDLTNARTTLKDFDASGYPRLVDALRLLDAAKVPE